MAKAGLFGIRDDEEKYGRSGVIFLKIDHERTQLIMNAVDDDYLKTGQTSNHSLPWAFIHLDVSLGPH